MDHLTNSRLLKSLKSTVRKRSLILLMIPMHPFFTAQCDYVHHILVLFFVVCAQLPCTPSNYSTSRKFYTGFGKQGLLRSANYIAISQCTWYSHNLRSITELRKWRNKKQKLISSGELLRLKCLLQQRQLLRAPSFFIHRKDHSVHKEVLSLLLP